MHFINNGEVNDVSLIKNIVELLEETKRILEGVSCYRWGSQTRLYLKSEIEKKLVFSRNNTLKGATFILMSFDILLFTRLDTADRVGRACGL